MPLPMLTHTCLLTASLLHDMPHKWAELKTKNKSEKVPFLAQNMVGNIPASEMFVMEKT